MVCAGSRRQPREFACAQRAHGFPAVQPALVLEPAGRLRHLRVARASAPPLGLITVAAMLPPDWNVRLSTATPRTLHDADIEWADLVMTGGMLPQQADTLRAHRAVPRARQAGRGRRPGRHLEPGCLRSGRLSACWARPRASSTTSSRPGRRASAPASSQAEKFKADVTKTPMPRFDLLKFEHYLYIGVQFSRGCPFTCEFCDIIELYGRVPRTKTNDADAGRARRALRRSAIAAMSISSTTT